MRAEQSYLADLGLRDFAIENYFLVFEPRWLCLALEIVFGPFLLFVSFFFNLNVFGRRDSSAFCFNKLRSTS